MPEGQEGREWRPGKATEFDDAMARRTLTPEEWEARYPKPPELRLRSDTPSVEVDQTTRVQEVLVRLANEDGDSVAVRNADGGVTAMMVPVERYLELVATELANNHQGEATLDGRIVPTEAAFAASYVEQVDPNATWVDTGEGQPS
jgi:hypothetical protein